MRTLRNILLRRHKVPALINTAGVTVWIASVVGHSLLLFLKRDSMPLMMFLSLMLAILASAFLAYFNRALWEKPGRILAVILLLILIHVPAYRLAETGVAIALPAAVVLVVASESRRLIRLARTIRSLPFRHFVQLRSVEIFVPAYNSFHFEPCLFRRPPPHPFRSN